MGNNRVIARTNQPRAPLSPAPARPVPQVFALSVQPALARDQLRRFLHQHRWEGDFDRVVLAAHEALTNAHRHGGGADRLLVWREESSVFVDVVDHGRGFDPLPYLARVPARESEGGRGLWLIVRSASDWSLHPEPAGVRLRLRFDPD